LKAAARTPFVLSSRVVKTRARWLEAAPGHWSLSGGGNGEKANPNIFCAMHF